MEFVEVQWNTSTELFNIVASLQPDREGLHEIVSCELFDKSRGVVGDALGNLLIFERIGSRANICVGIMEITMKLTMMMMMMMMMMIRRRRKRKRRSKRTKDHTHDDHDD
eukprot:763225-Hanusia_phi.AAC.2